MDIIGAHAARQPDKPAVIDGDRRITWAEFCARRNRLTRGLLGLGVARGEHVVVYGLNSLETLLAGAAVRAMGAVAVPMNHRLVPEEVGYILDDADAVAVFGGDAFVPTIEQVRGKTARVRHWILMEQERRPWALPLDDVMAASAEPVESPGAGGTMIYTAGTTGKPKGALRGPVDAVAAIERLRALNLADPDHVHLLAGPSYHSAPGGFALYAQLLGSTVVVMRRFDPEEALATIERHRCTSTFMAPTLVKRLVDLSPAIRSRYDVSSLRVLVTAGAPCPMKVKEDAVACFGPILHEFYGSTELGINTILRPADLLRKPSSCGTAAPGIRLAILDDGGHPVPPGTPGQLFVGRYDGVFDGYYKNARATAETARGEWLSVGDVAWMDAEGFVYICDRKRDMIISGGVNIYPAEIEDVLHRHPKILDVAVFGVPDDEWGERIHVAVQVRPGESLLAEDVIAFARARVAGYKVPREVSFHAAFPRDSAGKLLKRVLREPHWAGRATRV